MKKWCFIVIVLNLIMVHVIATEPAAPLEPQGKKPEEKMEQIKNNVEVESPPSLATGILDVSRGASRPVWRFAEDQ